MRGVVVGDEDDRARRVRVACLRDHVPGRAMRQRAAAEPELAAAHVVVDGRRGGAADGRGRPPASGAATAEPAFRRPSGRKPPVARSSSTRPRGSRPRGTRPRATRRRAARPLTRTAARTRRARGPLARSGRSATRRGGSLAPCGFSHASPAPIRSSVVGCVPNSACSSRGGSGSETLRSAIRRSNWMKAPDPGSGRARTRRREPPPGARARSTRRRARGHERDRECDGRQHRRPGPALRIVDPSPRSARPAVG